MPFSSTQPSLRARVLPRFPANVLAGNGVTITKSGGTYTFSVTTELEELTVVDHGTVASGTVSFGVSDGSKHRLTISGPLTVSFVGWPVADVYGEIEIELVNGGLGVTWPTINWLIGDGNSTPVFGLNGVTLNSSGTNWVIIWSTDGGTTLWGRAA